MALYMVYVWHIDDADPHEWIIDESSGVAERIEQRLASLWLNQRAGGRAAPRFTDYGVRELEAERGADLALEEFITDLEQEIDAPAVHAGA